jgi:hypothetical protein
VKIALRESAQAHKLNVVRLEEGEIAWAQLHACAIALVCLIRLSCD